MPVLDRMFCSLPGGQNRLAHCPLSVRLGFAASQCCWESRSGPETGFRVLKICHMDFDLWVALTKSKFCNFLCKVCLTLLEEECLFKASPAIIIHHIVSRTQIPRHLQQKFCIVTCWLVIKLEFPTKFQ